MKAYQVGDYRTALIHGETWLLSHPDDADTRILIGRAAMATGDTILALDYFRPLVPRVANDGKLNKVLLGASMRQGDLLFARQLLTADTTGFRLQQEKRKQQLALVERRIHDSMLAVRNGDLALAEDRLQKAVSSYRIALDNHAAQREYQARLMLAEAMIFAETFGDKGIDQAFERIDSARSLWPDSPLPYWVEGMVANRFGRKERARTALNEALARGIEEPFATKARSMIAGGR